MPKLDIKKELKELYFPSRQQVEIVDVPSMNFLMIDGEGDPNTAQSYKEAIQALHNVSVSLQLLVKETKGIDFTLMPLENLWWVAEKNKFKMEVKEEWKWTTMAMQPKYVTPTLFDKAIEDLKRKKIPSLSKIRLERFKEGLCAQILHIGPYSEQAPAVEKIHDFIWENGFKLRGRHHEIYLSDPQQTSSEKIKTILRQPVIKE